MRILYAIAALLVSGMSITVSGQYSQRLTDPAHTAAAAYCASWFIVDGCCDHTPLATCRKTKPNCSLAAALHNYLSWLTLLGRDTAAVRTSMEERHAFFTTEPSLTLPLSPFPQRGDSAAKVSVYVYISAACPRCKSVTMNLASQVDTGSLKGIARLAVLPFGTGIGDRALIAANNQGYFWRYLNILSGRSGLPDAQTCLVIARQMAMDTSRFKNDLASRAVADTLNAAKQRGRERGVTVTPGVFINGRHLPGSLDPEWIHDAVLFFKPAH